MVGLGGLEPPTSPLSGARSSHLSYRPLQNRVATAYNSFSLRRLSVIRNCVQISWFWYEPATSFNLPSRCHLSQ